MARHFSRRDHKPKSHAANEGRLLQRAVHANAIMSEYEEAHVAVVGVRVKCEYKNGWVTVNGEHLRLDQVEKATALLWASQHEAEIDAPD